MKKNIVFSILTIVFVSFTISAKESELQEVNKHKHHHDRKHITHHAPKKLHRIADPSYQN